MSLSPNNENTKQLQFSLSIEETNLILEALGQMPFIKVHQLISSIQQQAASQLQNNQPTPPTDS